MGFSKLFVDQAFPSAGRSGVHRRQHGVVLWTYAAVLSAAPRFSRDPAILLRAGIFQAAIMLLDAGSVWVLLRSIGVAAAPAAVFAAFMVQASCAAWVCLPEGWGPSRRVPLWL